MGYMATGVDEGDETQGTGNELGVENADGESKKW